MNILVTGAAGFIGSNLAEYLLDKDYKVVGIDNFNEYYPRKIKEFNIESIKDHKNFKFSEIDITDRDALENLFKEENIDAIVHLAAWAGVTPSVKKPSIYAWVNYDGTNNLAEFAVQNDVKNFIFASTSSVYGNNNETPFTEDMDTSHPAAPYPASKKAGEVLLYTYSQNFNLPVTVLRFFNPLGPKLRPDMAMPKLVRSALYGNEFPVYQNPESSLRDFTYIKDMIEAIEYNINHPLDYEIINLGNSEPKSLLDLMSAVEKVSEGKIKTIENPLPGQMEITYANIEKAKELLKYDPKTTLEEMVKVYYDWFLDQPEWYKKGEY